jgi:hypothetical protein
MISREDITDAFPSFVPPTLPSLPLLDSNCPADAEETSKFKLLPSVIPEPQHSTRPYVEFFLMTVRAFKIYKLEDRYGPEAQLF